jgi:serine/threonine-protein kinase
VEDPTTERLPTPDQATQARAAELVGQVVSQRYRIDELLAMGGMGAVYRGHHLHLKKRVALKVLRPETDNLPELVARFEREAIAGAHVAHPNVAAATDFGQLDDGSYFLVLEYVSGQDLRRVIRQGPLPPARAAHIARQLAAGLAAAHAMGIVHRDVKPQNVMLIEGKDDLVKLIDFGLAKVPVDRVVSRPSVRPPALSRPDTGRPPRQSPLDSQEDTKPRLTGVDTIMGTVAYLAPEAALGSESVDARADLYALGIVLYQMLTGLHPFDADNDAALFAQQRFTPPPPFAERAPDVVVPPALEAVVMRLLAKDPAERYPTGTAVVEALDAAVAPPATAPLPAPPPAPGRGLRSLLPVGVGVAAVAFGVAAAFFFNASSAGPKVGVAPSSAVAAAPDRSAATAPLTGPTAPSPAPVPPPASPAAAPREPASAAPHASAVVVATAAPEGGEVAAKRAEFLRTLRVRDFAAGEAVFLDLVEHDPDAFRDPEIGVAVRDLAVALDRMGSADRVFEALTSRLGPRGLDVLYDLVATRGKAGAALRAATVLRQKGNLGRASPEMRIAFELREAPCIEKLGMLDRAAAQGDGRALVVLQTQGVACFKKNNRAVQEAMAALRARLHRGQ